MKTSHDKIELFGRHTSYNVQKVLWLAEELSLEYDHKEVGGRFGGNDTTTFLSMNPTGKVPFLRQGNRLIWESNSIIRYLADMYGNGKWISSEPYTRTITDRWLDWSIDRFEKAFIGVFWGYYRTQPENRKMHEIEKNILDCESCLRLLGMQLSDNNFLTGDHPTVADIATGVFLHRLNAIDIDISMPKNIHLWYERLSKRPGYIRWVMSDFSELKGRASY